MRRSALACAAPLLLVLLSLASCGGGRTEGDPAAVDNVLNQAIAREEAERQRLVLEARAREAVRVREMEQNAQNYAETPD